MTWGISVRYLYNSSITFDVYTEHCVCFLAIAEPFIKMVDVCCLGFLQSEIMNSWYYCFLYEYVQTIFRTLTPWVDIVIHLKCIQIDSGVLAGWSANHVVWYVCSSRSMGRRRGRSLPPGGLQNLLPDNFGGFEPHQNRQQPGLCPRPHWWSLEHFPRHHSWWGGELANSLPKNPTPHYGPSGLKLNLVVPLPEASGSAPVCVSDSICHTGELCKKRLNRSRCHLGNQLCDLRNDELGGLLFGWVYTPQWGVTRRRCGLVPNYLEHLLNVNFLFALRHFVYAAAVSYQLLQKYHIFS